MKIKREELYETLRKICPGKYSVGFAKISLDNAYKNVSEDIKKRNSKMKKRKKNYYKENDPFDV